MVRFLKVFTFLSRERIEELERETQENPRARAAQKALAHEVTTWVHGEQETVRVKPPPPHCGVGMLIRCVTSTLSPWLAPLLIAFGAAGGR